MFFTAYQNISFFEDSDQMGLSNRTRTLSLIIEGIAAVDDLAGWDDNYWNKWNSNCKKPAGFKIPTILPISFLKYPLKYQAIPWSAWR